MRPAGHLLTALPRQLGIEDEDSRACASAAECFACCYAVDLCCAVPFQGEVEQGHNRFNLMLFVFYEACWPCMRIARACGCLDDEGIRKLARRRPLRGFEEPETEVLNA